MKTKSSSSWFHVETSTVGWALYLSSAVIFLYYERVLAISNIPTFTHFLIPFGICLGLSILSSYFAPKLPFHTAGGILFGTLMLISVFWFIAVMEVPFGLEGITKGSFADSLWMQPVIISLYFGIALPFLNRWISEINQNTATSQQQHDENGEEEPVPVVAKLKEATAILGFILLISGIIARYDSWWVIFTEFLISLGLAVLVGLISIKNIQSHKIESNFKLYPSKRSYRFSLNFFFSHLSSIVGLGWVWLAIISFNGFKFENLAPFGWGIIGFYIIDKMITVYPQKIEKSRLTAINLTNFYQLLSLSLIIMGSIVMWWLHLNMIHLNLVLYPISLSGFIFAVSIRQLETQLFSGLKMPPSDNKAKKKGILWPNVYFTIDFLVFLFMDLLFLVHRVGYYGTVDFIVFKLAIVFAASSFIIHFIFRVISTKKNNASHRN